MDEYPNMAIEAIIREELERGKETGAWTSPQARFRYCMLLAERIVSRPDASDTLQQLRRIFEARRELAGFCTDRFHLFTFQGPAQQGFLNFMDQIEDAHTCVLARMNMWPSDSLISHETGETSLLVVCRTIGDIRETAKKGFEEGSRVLFSSQHAVMFDFSLYMGRLLLMTGAEGKQFDESFNRAQEQLRHLSRIYEMPDSAPIH